MRAIETTANFNENREIEIDNLPFIKNQKVKLLILLEEHDKMNGINFRVKTYLMHTVQKNLNITLLCLKNLILNINHERRSNSFNSFAVNRW